MNSMANLNKLKKMIEEPASKEWFKKHGLPKSIKNHVAKKMHKKEELEERSKKAGFYVHGHKNFGDVYEK